MHLTSLFVGIPWVGCSGKNVWLSMDPWGAGIFALNLVSKPYDYVFVLNLGSTRVCTA
jgi:hypothetical protein